MSSPTPVQQNPAAASAMAAAKREEYNRLHLDFHLPMPRPKVVGRCIDFHSHLLARRHAPGFFQAESFYGFDLHATMTPLEEAVTIARDYPGRLHFITVPRWQDEGGNWVDQWLRRLEAFYNLGSRIIKFHMAPGTMAMRKWNILDPNIRKIRMEAKARGMIMMSHVGDPDTWYNSKYSDAAKFGTREQHYDWWRQALEEHRDQPWLGAHLGGNPEDLDRLQLLLDDFPNLMLDCSATRWMVREVSLRRDATREFFIRNQDRIVFGSDQVTGNDRDFDFLASRLWSHRKLWETAYVGPCPIVDPDLPPDQQPVMRGLALPDEVLQKIYRDNGIKLLAKVGAGFDESLMG